LQKYNSIDLASKCIFEEVYQKIYIILSISLSCVKDVLKGKQKSSKGFIFKYLEE